MTNLIAPHHAEALRKSAITEAVIEARGYRTITDADELKAFGFAPAQCRVPGLLLPLWTPDGGNGLCVYRPDNPRVEEDKRKGKNPDGTYPNRVIKYEYPKGEAMRLDCPPLCQEQIGDPSVPLWITEGQKKADSLASVGLCAIALLGVWNFIGKNEFGGSTFLADWKHVALNGRKVRIIFDSDVMGKREVRKALTMLTELLQRKGASVDAVYLPANPDGGGKVGVDDYLASGRTVDDLEALIEAPRPTPQAALPVIELLDVAPEVMRRPLALIGGKACVATWLHTRVTVRESLTAKGEVVRHNPPIVKTEPRLFVVREDGAIFGEGMTPLNDLSIDVRLPEMPPTDKTWSTIGVKAFRDGARPNPADVFRRVADVVDRFIDFDRSLAEQRVMAEAIACYCLSTWMLDAFSVIGFIWPNGDRGSGKTHLLLTIAELSYLGQVILAGGSYASLRDLADYGATLAFDDAENFSDPRKSDPDKRALLLAGNRRGATVTIKELGPDKNWHTRHVNAFCPRLFSAIRLPDPILASRTIIIPLIRTPDRKRANADPLDYASWPHDRRQLVDDLWALGLAHLPELPRWDEWVGQNAKLAGRNLQPGRAMLAVAVWLDANGVPGLWQRMESLSLDYQNERPNLEIADLTALVIRALCQCAARDVSGVSDVSDVSKETPALRQWTFATSRISEAAAEIARDEEADIDPDWVNSRRVGRVLGKMRLRQARQPGKGTRQWIITSRDFHRWTLSYGLPLPGALADGEIAEGDNQPDPLSANVTNVTDVTNVTPDDTDLYSGEL